MKKWLYLILAIAIAIPTAALAHGGGPGCEGSQCEPPGPPPAPTCAEGQFTITPAQWVPEECSCPKNLTFDGWYKVKWGHIWIWKYFSVTFDYGKSSDPHKCHRPTASSLNIPSDLRDDFNREFPEWLKADCTPGYWTEPVCGTPEFEGYLELDCNGYAYVVDGGQYGEVTYTTPNTGAWQDLYGPEAVTVTGYVTFPDKIVLDFEQAIEKPEGCIQCKITPMYTQSVYIPDNPPPSYWQGPFGFPACAVIHKADEIPGAERITTLCSLCPDQIEGGFIFNAIRKPITDQVLKVSCYGKQTHYTFHGYLWDEYYRGEDFDRDGNRCTPYVEGCSDWIAENSAQ